MSVKQDRQGARTPADVERRFGGTLNDVSGVAADAQKRAEYAEQEVENLKYRKITVDQLDIEGEELNIKVAATNITGKLKAEQIDAKGLTVEAANIIGKLKAEQIEGIDISVQAADIQGKLTAEQIDTTNLEVDAANVKGKLTAEQIDATDLKVKAANIEDKLTASQINADDMIIQKAVIGGWHLAKIQINVDASNFIEEYALYSDEMYEKRTDSEGVERTYTYQVYLTAKGVYVRGRYDTSNETAVPYYANKTWLEICGG